MTKKLKNLILDLILFSKPENDDKTTTDVYNYLVTELLKEVDKK